MMKGFRCIVVLLFLSDLIREIGEKNNFAIDQWHIFCERSINGESFTKRIDTKS